MLIWCQKAWILITLMFLAVILIRLTFSIYKIKPTTVQNFKILVRRSNSQWDTKSHLSAKLAWQDFYNLYTSSSQRAVLIYLGGRVTTSAEVLEVLLCPACLWLPQVFELYWAHRFPVEPTCVSCTNCCPVNLGCSWKQLASSNSLFQCWFCWFQLSQCDIWDISVDFPFFIECLGVLNHHWNGS